MAKSATTLVGEKPMADLAAAANLDAFNGWSG
jgi:hypothetical protein